MRLSGGCHCGAVRYEIEGEAVASGLCHCTDCRKASGAPFVGWLMLPEAAVKISGSPQIYASSEHGRRSFCSNCGTGLFYVNAAVLPGLIDVQSATLDDPEAAPPRAHIMGAERLSWTRSLEALPEFSHYPPGL